MYLQQLDDYCVKILITDSNIEQRNSFAESIWTLVNAYGNSVESTTEA